MSDTQTILQPAQPERRIFLNGIGKATLSATAVALLVGCESLTKSEAMQSASNPAQDVSILNVALGLEHEAIAAYQIGADSGLLQPAVKKVAVLFQSQHREHRDALAATVGKLGGKPVQPKRLSEYSADLEASKIMSQGDILKLAARL